MMEKNTDILADAIADRLMAGTNGVVCPRLVLENTDWTFNRGWNREELLRELQSVITKWKEGE